LLPDDLLAEAHLLDHSPEAGVACISIFFLDTDGGSQRGVRD
jgi:hypothetical protein